MSESNMQIKQNNKNIQSNFSLKNINNQTKANSLKNILVFMISNSSQLSFLSKIERGNEFRKQRYDDANEWLEQLINQLLWVGLLQDSSKTQLENRMDLNKNLIKIINCQTQSHHISHFLEMQHLTNSTFMQATKSAKVHFNGMVEEEDDDIEEGDDLGSFRSENVIKEGEDKSLPSLVEHSHHTKQEKINQVPSQRKSLAFIKDNFLSFLDKQQKNKARSKPLLNKMLSTIITGKQQPSGTSLSDDHYSSSSMIKIPIHSLKNIGEAPNLRFLRKKGSIMGEEAFEFGLVEVSESRKKEMQSMRMKEQRASIMTDYNISDDQRQIKLNNLNYSILAERVKNVIQKTKKLKENQYKSSNKEQKFENQLKIFKNLDTFIETKSYLQKMNSMTDSTKSKLHKAVHKINSISARIKNNSSYSNDESKIKEFPIFVKELLEKSHSYVQAKKGLIKSQQNERDPSSKDNEMIKKVINSSFERYLDKEDMFAGSDCETDSNQFYQNLSKQFQTGKFISDQTKQYHHHYISKGFFEREETCQAQSSSTNKGGVEQEERIEDVIIEEILEDKKKNKSDCTNKEILEDYRNKAKKITQMLLQTSKSILQKKIEETNNVINQARHVKAAEKVQHQLNIKALNSRIKRIPNKYKIQRLDSQAFKKEEEDILEEEKKQELIDKKKLLKEVLNLKPTARQLHDLDAKLSKLEDSFANYRSNSGKSSPINSIKEQYSSPKSSSRKINTHLNKQNQDYTTSCLKQEEIRPRKNTTETFSTESSPPLPPQLNNDLSFTQSYFKDNTSFLLNNKSYQKGNKDSIKLSPKQSKSDYLLKKQYNHQNRTNRSNSPNKSSLQNFTSYSDRRTYSTTFNLQKKTNSNRGIPGKSTFITNLNEIKSEDIIEKRKTLPTLFQSLKRKNENKERTSKFKSCTLATRKDQMQIDSLIKSISQLQVTFTSENKAVKKQIDSIQKEINSQKSSIQEPQLESLRLCFKPLSPLNKNNQFSFKQNLKML